MRFSGDRAAISRITFADGVFCMIALRRLAVVAAVAVLAAAGSPRAAEAQGRSVVGTYTGNINSPNGVVKAVIVLKRENGTYSGSLAAEGFPLLPVTSVTSTDTTVTVMADTPDGGVVIVIKFAPDNKVTGKVSYQGIEMDMDGTFAPATAMTASPPDADATTAQFRGRVGQSVTVTVTVTLPWLEQTAPVRQLSLTAR